MINTKVIDGVLYKDVTEAAPANSSRALVPAGQPYDSRTALALEQIKRAKRLRSPGGQAMGQSVIAGWNDLFTADPNGLETLAAMQRAEFARAEAEHRERMRQAALAEARQRPPEPSRGEELVRALCFQATRALAAHQNMARANNAEDRPADQKPSPDRFRELQTEARPSLLDRIRAEGPQ